MTGYTRREFTPDTCPVAVSGVVAQIAARTFQVGNTAVGVESEAAGPFNRSFSAGASSGGPWLAATDKMTLRPYRRGGGSSTVQLVSERYNATPPDEV